MNESDTRRLGASEIIVSALGVGVLAWGDARMSGYGKSFTREDVTQAYRTSLDVGITLFDTAEFYGFGESERLLGECIRQEGRPVSIAGKFSVHFSADALLGALDQSLARLGVDCLDLYQIHTPSPFLKIDALMDALAEAVRLGKTRAVGVSNYSAAMMRQAHARLATHGVPLASNQVQYSLLHRYPEQNGVLEACRELDVALIAYSPLAEGVLTGKFRNAPLKLSPVRRFAREVAERFDLMGDMQGTVPLSKRLFSTPRTLNPKKLEPLFVVMEEIANAHGKTIAQVALNWLVNQDARVIAIPGAKNARQARDNGGALGWRLTDEEQARISEMEEGLR